MVDEIKDPRLYVYTQLSSRKFIRLLELYPGHANDNVTCTLRQIELENAPEYEAISYAWGNPANESEVFCDGKIIVVTPNLKDALLRLRLEDKSRLVWADAICINQEDDVEKGAQVKIMETIFARAMKVCIWLGRTTPQMQPTFDLIEEMAGHSSPLSVRMSSRPDKLVPYFDIA
jgi:hypothetical protein